MSILQLKELEAKIERLDKLLLEKIQEIYSLRKHIDFQQKEIERLSEKKKRGK